MPTDGVPVSAAACAYLLDLMSVCREEQIREAVPGHLMVYSLADAELLLFQGQGRAEGTMVKRASFVEPLYWLARFAVVHGPDEHRAEMARIARDVADLIGISAVDLLGDVGRNEP